jgi:polyphosphate glucokinase
MAAKKKAAVPSKKKITSTGPYTLAIDIGGTGLKASILDAQGKMTHERVRIPTPANCPPKLMLTKLKELIALIPATVPKFDRISVGFPGVVRAGKIYTAHNLGTKPWVNFDLANALKKQFGKPCRVLNDADLQGLAAINQLGGKGVEMVITLGTGLGSSLFENGRLLPHMEFAHHPFRQDETYEEQIGDVAREDVGKKRWNKRVKLAIEALHHLINFDRLYIGGGNAEKIAFKLPPYAKIIPNTLGMVGGVYLWGESNE